MTTIAIDPESIACDGMTLIGDEIMWLDAEKIKVFDDGIFAFAGSSQIFSAAIEWVRTGAKVDDMPKPVDDMPWSMIRVTSEGAMRWSFKSPYGYAIPVPFAIGSGGDVAIGAMAAGASAEQAVRIASRLHTNTGGRVRVVKFQDVFGKTFPATHPGFLPEGYLRA